MRVLLILAHGSRREASNEEVRLLAATLRSRLQGRFDRVEAAFLELAPPSIGDGIDEAVAAGACEIVLLPYFLAAGRHVVTDIPQIVDERRQRHPQVAIRLERYLGAAPGLVDLLVAELSAR